VTFNRSHLLTGCLDGLAAQSASIDESLWLITPPQRHPEVLAGRTDLPITLLRQTENSGGAGGFHVGVKAAYQAGHDVIWLMDDDVVAHPGCLAALLATEAPAAMVVREGPDGQLAEKSACGSTWPTPWVLKPKQGR
jgi:GT2 family glycosyltransferase